MEPAPSETILLLDKSSGQTIDSMQSDFFGRYMFTGLHPGVYLLKGKAVATGPTDPELMKRLAGYYWGYSGSTDSKMNLCPDGSYWDTSESSYSGTLSGGGSFGTVGGSGGKGRWTVQGTLQAGTITVTDPNGRVREVRYQAKPGDAGTYSFNGTVMARAGDASCD